MAERGAKPNVHPLRARALRAISAFTSPLLPDDYLEMINPLWSTREVRGRVEELNREAGDATTVLIRPGHTWPGHEPGQYLRIGFDVDGIRHWRAYSITSDPGPPRRLHLDHPEAGRGGQGLALRQPRAAARDDRRRSPTSRASSSSPIRGPSGSCSSRPAAGSRRSWRCCASLDREDELDDAVHLHSAPTPDDVIFGDRMRELDAHNEGLRLHIQHTREGDGRITPDRPRRALPRLARARDVPLRARRDARRLRAALEGRGPRGASSTWSASSRSSAATAPARARAARSSS